MFSNLSDCQRTLIIFSGNTKEYSLKPFLDDLQIRMKMMNVLALSLVLTTLATAGVLSPAPEKKQDVIVKDGHRVVVVEYEKDQGNTKVLISPHESSSEDVAAEKGGEKMVDDDDEGGSYYRRRTTPGELVCDAFGRCRRKIAGAFDRTKDTAPEKAEEARGAVSEGLGKVRDTVVDKGRKAAEKAYEAEEEARDAVREGLGKVKDTVADKGNKAAKKVYEMEEGAREAITERLQTISASTAETAKDAAEGIKTDASRKMEHVREQLSDKAKKAQEKVGEAKDSAKQNILLRSAAGRVSGMANLIGLAIAYGMSVWVTFVSSYVLARALPRQQFAVAQSKIYPVYFKAMAYSIGTAFLGHLFSQTQRLHSKFLGFNLLFSLLMVLANLFYLEPRATKVMFERMKMEKEEGRGKGSIQTERGGDGGSDHPAGVVDGGGTATATEIAEKKQRERAEEGGATAEMMRLSRKLKKLNSYSSFLNVVTLMCLTLYLADLGQRLHVAC